MPGYCFTQCLLPSESFPIHQSWCQLSLCNLSYWHHQMKFKVKDQIGMEMLWCVFLASALRACLWYIWVRHKKAARVGNAYWILLVTTDRSILFTNICLVWDWFKAFVVVHCWYWFCSWVLTLWKWAVFRQYVLPQSSWSNRMYPEDGGSLFLWSITYLPNYTV